MNAKNLHGILAEAGIKVVDAKTGDDEWLSAMCPFAPYLHRKKVDSNPSFYAIVQNQSRSSCHCFTCKRHGSVSSILRQLSYLSGKNMSSLIIRADLAEITPAFGEWEDIPQVKKRVALVEETFLNMYPPVSESGDATHYLHSRGISDATARKLGLRYDPWEKRVLFPVRGGKGELYGFAGRSYDETSTKRHRVYSFTKSLCLLGENFIDKSKPNFVVEGLFAYAHLIEIGADQFANILAPMGSSISDQQRDILCHTGQVTYLCFDLDTTGTLATFGMDGKSGIVGEMKSHLHLRLPLYPDDVCDPDHLSLKQFQKMLADFDSV